MTMHEVECLPKAYQAQELNILKSLVKQDRVNEKTSADGVGL